MNNKKLKTFFFSIKKFFIRQVAMHARNYPKDSIEYWRRVLFYGIYYIIFGCTIIAYTLAMFYHASREKTMSVVIVMGIDTVIVILISLIVFVKFVPFRVKSILGSFLFYILGLVILLVYGPFSDAQAWFIGFIFLANLFVGLKFSVATTIIVYATNLIVGLVINRYISYYKINDIHFSRWFIISTNFFLMSLVVIFAINIFLSKLMKLFKNAEQSRNAIIVGLAKLTEYKDNFTREHLDRMSRYTVLIAERLSEIDENGIITRDYLENLRLSSILHDIGKVGIPDNILLKPDKLTKEEFEVIKNHSTYGGDVLDEIAKNVEDKTFYTIAKYIAYYHHEKWDGTGYPKGLKGEEIPLSARIVALADVYDALTTKRSYKESFSHETARQIIIRERGKHFDPLIVDIFIECENEFIKINETFKS